MSLAGTVVLVLVIGLVITGLGAGGGTGSSQITRAEIGHKTHVKTGSGEADVTVLGVQWTTDDSGASQALLGLEVTPTSGTLDVAHVTCDPQDRSVPTDEHPLPPTPWFPRLDRLQPGTTVRGLVALKRPRGPCELTVRGVNGGNRAPTSFLAVPLPAADAGQAPLSVRPEVPTVQIGQTARAEDAEGTYAARVLDVTWIPTGGRPLLCVTTEVSPEAGGERSYSDTWEYASDSVREDPDPFVVDKACPASAGSVPVGQSATGRVVFTPPRREAGRLQLRGDGGAVRAVVPIPG